MAAEANAAHRFVVRPGWLPILGERLGSLNALSPLQTNAPHVPPGGDRQLREAGILDLAGCLSPAYRPALEVLARPGCFVRLQLLFNRRIVEHTLFYPPGGKVAVTISPGAGGLQISHPAGTQDFVRMLSQWTGASRMIGLPYEAETSSEEALVLAALIDDRRRGLLGARAAGTSPNRPAAMAGMLADWIQSAPDEPFWLTAVVRRAVEGAPLESLSRVESALEGLLTARLISRCGSGFALTADTATLAERFQAPDRVLVLAAGILENGTRVRIGSTYAVQASVNDMLLVAPAGRIHFKTVAPARFLAYLERFLDAPEQHQRTMIEQDAAATTGTASTGFYCGECGALLEADCQFCTECGERVEP